MTMAKLLITIKCTSFLWPWWSAGAILSASPNAACPGLLQKPPDATIGWLLAPYSPSHHQGNSKQTTINKYTYFAGHFNCQGSAPVRNHTHRPMKEVQGFTRSHWTLPLGKYLLRHVSLSYEPRWSYSFGGTQFWWFGENSFFEQYDGNSIFPWKEGWVQQKGGQCPFFEGKKGSCQIFNTKMY